MAKSAPASYEFACENLYPDCSTTIKGKNEEEVWRKAQSHVREHHGIRNFNDETVRDVRLAIRVV